MQRPKKDSHKENALEKNSCTSKIPHPPHNFSNGPSPSRAVTLVKDLCLVRNNQVLSFCTEFTVTLSYAKGSIS